MRKKLLDEILRLKARHDNTDISDPIVRQQWDKEAWHIALLTVIGRVKAYEDSLTCDAARCKPEVFERYLRANARVEKALAKLTKFALALDVTALKELTVQIGSRFLTFPVWCEFDAIPFRVEDMDRLIESKGQSISSLIDALAGAGLPLLVSQEFTMDSNQYGLTGAKFLTRSGLLALTNAVSKALWIDFDLAPTSYTVKAALTDDFKHLGKVFHREPQPGDDLKIVTLRVNLYKNFNQRIHGFAPIPYAVYPIFLLVPIAGVNCVE